MISENPRWAFLFDPDDQVFVLTLERPGDVKRSIEAFNELIQKSARGADKKNRGIALKYQELRRRKQIGLIVHSYPNPDIVGSSSFSEELGGVYIAIVLRPEYHLGLDNESTKARTRADTLKVVKAAIQDIDYLERDGRNLMRHEDFEAMLIAEHMGMLSDAARLN